MRYPKEDWPGRTSRIRAKRGRRFVRLGFAVWLLIAVGLTHAPLSQAAAGDGTPETSITGNPRGLTGAASVTFRFASDASTSGARLAWVDRGEILAIVPAWGDIDNLTRNAAGDEGPTWSPDGTKLAFSSDRDGLVDLYAMNADGTGVVRLGDSPGQNWDPA